MEEQIMKNELRFMALLICLVGFPFFVIYISKMKEVDGRIDITKLSFTNMWFQCLRRTQSTHE